MSDSEYRNTSNQENEIEKIDIMEILFKSLKVVRKIWWLGVILLVLGGACSVGYNKLFYVPEYTASATFTVTIGNSKNLSTYQTNMTLNQMTETFPYILESGALKDVVAKDLGLTELDATISASVLKDTSLFEMKVVASDGQMAYDILSSVIEHYPSVSEYIIGDTNLTMLDNSGVPINPSNAVGIRRQAEYGVLIGLLVFLVILAIMVAARRTVAAEDDLKAFTSLRCLVSIPKVTLKRRSNNKTKALLVNQKGISPAFVESVNTLRIRLVRVLHKVKHPVVLVTSTNEGEGKTTTTVNLALSIAQKDAKVLLIDADLRHPSVCEKLGMEQKVGLGSVLAGDADLANVITPYHDSALHVLAGTEKMPTSRIPALLGSADMEEILKVCKEEYDYIFIDTPPCGVMQDASLIAPNCDSALMVIRQDYVPRDKILAALESIADTGCKLAGYCINSEDTGIGSYGYGRYGYGKYGYSSKGYKKYGYGEKKA